MKMRAFTLMELIVVVIIIGIMVTFAMPQFARTKEKALDKEAQANLKLIIAAEKIYRMEYGFYYPHNFAASPSLADINSFLKLSIAAGTGSSWDYAIANASANACCAQARRKTGNRRYWHMANNADDATTGDCQ